MKRVIDFKSLLFFSLVLGIGSLQGLLYAYTMRATDDPMQLLRRGVKLATLGQWTHFGAAVTGGGFVPGSLTTALIGLPLFVWDSPFAYEITLLFLQLVGLYFLWRSLKGTVPQVECWAFLAFFWLSPWRASFAILWNPGYLFFVSGLHLYTATRMAKNKSWTLSFWHGFSLMVALQLHASFALLVFVTAYLILRKLMKMDWWGFVSSLLLGLVSLIPYFYTLSTQPKIAPVLDPARGRQFYYGRGFIEIAQLAKGIYYWPRYSSAIFPNYIFNWLHFDGIADPQWRSILANAFLVVRYGVGIPTLVLSFFAFFWMLRKVYRNRGARFVLPDFLDNYTLAALLAIVAAAAASPAEFSSWHLLVFLPIANVNFVQWVFHGIHQWPFGLSPKKFFMALCCYFVCYNSIIVFLSDEHSWTNNIHTQYQTLKKEILKDPSHY
jgi:hypothetical protein